MKKFNYQKPSSTDHLLVAFLVTIMLILVDALFKLL